MLPSLKKMITLHHPSSSFGLWMMTFLGALPPLVMTSWATSCLVIDTDVLSALVYEVLIPLNRTLVHFSATSEETQPAALCKRSLCTRNFPRASSPPKCK